MNSINSMGAPFSTMKATRTPLEGLFGAIRISVFSSYDWMSLVDLAKSQTAFPIVEQSRGVTAGLKRYYLKGSIHFITFSCSYLRG